MVVDVNAEVVEIAVVEAIVEDVNAEEVVLPEEMVAKVNVNGPLVAIVVAIPADREEPVKPEETDAIKVVEPLVLADETGTAEINKVHWIIDE